MPSAYAPIQSTVVLDEKYQKPWLGIDEGLNGYLGNLLLMFLCELDRFLRRGSLLACSVVSV